MKRLGMIPLCVAFAATGAQAQTKFGIKLLDVGGNTNFQATSVNAKGVIVGTLYHPSTGDAFGTILDHGTVTTIPSPEGAWGNFNPRAINDRGDILGWARNGSLGLSDMFLWQGGAFNQAYQTGVVMPGNVGNEAPQPMSLTNNRKVSFNVIYSLSGPLGSDFGRPAHYHRVPLLNRYVHIESVNEASYTGGISYNQTGGPTAFLGQGKTYTPLLPNGAVNSAGGFLNDAGTIAGSYKDGKGYWHGFTYTGGAYTTFDMPEKASAVSVDAINSKGRVVGSYAAASDGKQHPFLWNGSTLSSFGDYRSSDDVKLAISNTGEMLLTLGVYGNALTYYSYRVLCGGTGC